MGLVHNVGTSKIMGEREPRGQFPVIWHHSFPSSVGEGAFMRLNFFECRRSCVFGLTLKILINSSGVSCVFCYEHFKKLQGICTFTLLKKTKQRAE